jgi:hypothetical protein
MKVIAGLILLVSGASLASAGSTRDEFGRSNCRNWNRLSDDQAIFYVAGLNDGMVTLSLDVPAANTRLDKYFQPDITLGEIQKGVNEICAQPENANIPVIFAVRAFTSKAHGAKPQDVEEYLRGLRGSTEK